MMGINGPNFPEKSAYNIRRAADRFKEDIIFISIDRSSGEISETFERRGIVAFENRRGEDISVVYDDRFQASIRVEREEVPDVIVPNQEADNPDQLYVPRIDTYFYIDDETPRSLLNSLQCVPLDQATVTI